MEAAEGIEYGGYAAISPRDQAATDGNIGLCSWLQEVTVAEVTVAEVTVAEVTVAESDRS